MKTFILLQHSTREDDDAVHLFYQKDLETRKELFKKCYLNSFKEFKIVEYEPHSGGGELEGYLILKTDNLKDVLKKIKDLITLTDKSWGEPYFYFAIFTLNSSLKEFSPRTVSSIQYNWQHKTDKNLKELILTNDFNDENSELDNLLKRLK